MFLAEIWIPKIYFFRVPIIENIRYRLPILDIFNLRKTVHAFLFYFREMRKFKFFAKMKMYENVIKT